MNRSLSLDLRVARRKAGLTQEDVGYLLGLRKTNVSRIERGARPVGLAELCALALIYDKTTDSLLAPLWPDAAADLAARLESMPAPKTPWIGTFNRQHTLSSLSDRLASNRSLYGDL